MQTAPATSSKKPTKKTSKKAAKAPKTPTAMTHLARLRIVTAAQAASGLPGIVKRPSSLQEEVPRHMRFANPELGQTRDLRFYSSHWYRVSTPEADELLDVDVNELTHGGRFNARFEVVSAAAFVAMKRKAGQARAHEFEIAEMGDR